MANCPSSPKPCCYTFHTTTLSTECSPRLPQQFQPASARPESWNRSNKTRSTLIRNLKQRSWACGSVSMSPPPQRPSDCWSQGDGDQARVIHYQNCLSSFCPDKRILVKLSMTHNNVYSRYFTFNISFQPISLSILKAHISKKASGSLVTSLDIASRRPTALVVIRRSTAIYTWHMGYSVKFIYLDPD